MAKSSNTAGFSDHRRWSAEEIGFLAGGPVSAAQAALTRLMDGGLVRISREGHVTAVHQNGYGANTPIEAAILNGLNGTAHPTGAVVWAAARSREMESLRQSLVDRGLVRRNRGMNRGSARGLQVLLLIATVPLTVLAFAVDRTYLLLAIIAFVISFLVRPKGLLTPAGRNVLRFARQGTRSQADVAALRGLHDNGGKRRKSHSHNSCGGGDIYVHSCGSPSSCMSSCCSSSSCSNSSSCGSSSSCSSSSSSCSSSSGSSCGSSSS